jgi:pyruvate formate lyase activating enzyme
MHAIQTVIDGTITGRAIVPVAGIQAMTAIDFPNRLAAVLFLKGCPWQCRYCHNAAIRNSDNGDVLPWERVERFLSDRAGFLDGIAVSGGEPTMHQTLPEFLRLLRLLGYAVALHTNGYFPARLSSILRTGLVEYVAMDVKAAPAQYDRITGVPNSSVEVARSIDAILASGVEYEFRTTWHPSLMSNDELLDTVRAVASVGAKRYYLQAFQPRGVEDDVLVNHGADVLVPGDIIAEATERFSDFAVR